MVDRNEQQSLHKLSPPANSEVVVGPSAEPDFSPCTCSEVVLTKSRTMSLLYVKVTGNTA